jgi:hypothetical protein
MLRTLGIALALGLRGALFAMLVDILRARPDDHRFVDKGLAPRFAAVGMPVTLVIPTAWLVRRITRRRPALDPYPVWMDDLLLSILALDMAGNVLDLYDRHRHFDLIPHGHGGGAATVLIAWSLRMPMRRAIVVHALGHALLEAQEYGSDVLFGTRNVRGWWDIAGDLGSGVAGSFAYAAGFEILVRRTGREPSSPFA